MNFKGKTVEEAITAALESLNVTEGELDITIVQEPVKGLLGLIGNKEAQIEVTLKETPISSLLEDEKVVKKETVKNVENNKMPLTEEDRQRKIEKGTGFLKEVLDTLEYPVEYFIRDEGEFIRIDIRGKNVGNLIGKRGETLYAFQYLVNLAANRNDDNSLKFIIDIEDFRKRREKTLDALANRLAKKVVETRKPVSLEPMNPLERKVIHMSLQEHEFVETISEGNEGQRYVKIILKETLK
ncbi:hypothetical protein AZF37_08950 [endosymbiont 'TC1' of Trimyema compressum]|uniref:RNA-binding cell elongation regulator Jag/EloR n=1 Tax=endosymbiont 'TC1' of Trimyema compressum TaxID=243899 RepID=UPI0007F0C20C|nr:RNA-binding cell elongation regulator Jag/EloR [endosymbiont 'TC1' of Trimyema compressum]AMP21253.1 hypothetical protein AZF37_08950 [endosymbiont 'TC1' of Trimyema compressum]